MRAHSKLFHTLLACVQDGKSQQVVGALETASSDQTQRVGIGDAVEAAALCDDNGVHGNATASSSDGVGAHDVAHKRSLGTHTAHGVSDEVGCDGALAAAFVLAALVGEITGAHVARLRFQERSRADRRQVGIRRNNRLGSRSRKRTRHMVRVAGDGSRHTLRCCELLNFVSKSGLLLLAEALAVARLCVGRNDLLHGLGGGVVFDCFDDLSLDGFLLLLLGATSLGRLLEHDLAVAHVVRSAFQLSMIGGAGASTISVAVAAAVVVAAAAAVVVVIGSVSDSSSSGQNRKWSDRFVCASGLMR